MVKMTREGDGESLISLLLLRAWALPDRETSDSFLPLTYLELILSYSSEINEAIHMKVLWAFRRTDTL